MICVSIARGRHKHVVAEHKHLVEQGVQLVELRLDWINGPIKFKKVLIDRPGPVILTLRRPSDGGRFGGTEEERKMLLRTGIVEGVDYVDLEEDIAHEIPRYGKTKRIISLHDFQKTPENLEEIHARMAKLDADVVKIATLANHPRDNLRMLRLIENSKIPTVGICMGEIGTPSRVLSGSYGAPFTFATFHHERSLAPGQLSYQQMKDLYSYDQITRKTEIYGVIGDPIGHSHSPLIHNTGFRHLGLDKVYLPFRVPREHLDDFLKMCVELGVRGLSVTIPHKESVLTHVHKIDKSVKGIGATNTLMFEPEGVSAFNTDYRGAIDSLLRVVPPSGDESKPWKGKTALILGAGGAAKAIAYGMRRRGAEVVISSRTREKAAELAERMECTQVPWESRHNFPIDILVNCTPVGMHPRVDETPFEKNYLRTSMVVFDTVYNPERTMLIRDAREIDCKVVTGIEMFMRQAGLQFKMFTGQEPPFEKMRDALKGAIGPVRY